MPERRRPSKIDILSITRMPLDDDAPDTSFTDYGRRIEIEQELRFQLTLLSHELEQHVKLLPEKYKAKAMESSKITARDYEILRLLSIPEANLLTRKTYLPALMCKSLSNLFKELCIALKVSEIKRLSPEDYYHECIVFLGEPGAGKTWQRVLCIEFFERHMGVFAENLDALGVKRAIDFDSHDISKKRFIESKTEEELIKLGHEPKKLSSPGVREGISNQLSKDLPQRISESLVFFFEVVGIVEIQYIWKRVGMMYAFDVIKQMAAKQGDFKDAVPINLVVVATAGGPLLRLLLSYVREAIKTPKILYKIAADAARRLKVPIIDEESWLLGVTTGSFSEFATVNYLLEVIGLPAWTIEQYNANAREGATVLQIEMLEQEYVKLINYMIDKQLIRPEEYIRVAIKQETGKFKNKKVQLNHRHEEEAKNISELLGIPIEVVRRKIGLEHGLMHLYKFMLDELKKVDEKVLSDMIIHLNNPQLGLDVRVPNKKLLRDLISLIDEHRSKPESTNPIGLASLVPGIVALLIKHRKS